MTLLFAIILFRLILENDYLLALAMLKHFCICGSTRDHGLADLDIFAISHQQNVEFNVCANLCVELLDHDLAANLDLVLFTAGYYDCVHSDFLLYPVSPLW